MYILVKVKSSRPGFALFLLVNPDFAFCPNWGAVRFSKALLFSIKCSFSIRIRSPASLPLSPFSIAKSPCSIKPRSAASRARPQAGWSARSFGSGAPAGRRRSAVCSWFGRSLRGWDLKSPFLTSWGGILNPTPSSSLVRSQRTASFLGCPLLPRPKQMRAYSFRSLQKLLRSSAMFCSSLTRLTAPICFGFSWKLLVVVLFEQATLIMCYKPQSFATLRCYAPSLAKLWGFSQIIRFPCSKSTRHTSVHLIFEENQVNRRSVPACAPARETFRRKKHPEGGSGKQSDFRLAEGDSRRPDFSIEEPFSSRKIALLKSPISFFPQFLKIQYCFKSSRILLSQQNLSQNRNREDLTIYFKIIQIKGFEDPRSVVEVTPNWAVFAFPM